MPTLTNAQKVMLRRVARGIMRIYPYYNVGMLRTHLYQVLPAGSKVTQKNISNTITNHWHNTTNF